MSDGIDTTLTGDMAAQDALMLEAARSLACARPQGPYAGWRFDADWDNADPLFRKRREIWDYFHGRRSELPFVMEWYDGLRVNLYLGNDLSRQLFVGGCIDPNEFAFLAQLLRPGMTFLDAGANDGLYTLFAAQRVGPSGKVLSIEPSPREYARLQENLRLNGFSNVRAYFLALLDKCGEQELAVAGYGHEGQNTLGAFIYEGVELLEKRKVAVRTLDQLAADEGIKRLDFLKLDVEGAELHVLQGAEQVLRDLCPTLLLEICDAALLNQGNSVEQLLAFLRSRGYSFYGFDPATGLPAPWREGDLSLNVIASARRLQNPANLQGFACDAP